MLEVDAISKTAVVLVTVKSSFVDSKNEMLKIIIFKRVAQSCHLFFANKK